MFIPSLLALMSLCRITHAFIFASKPKIHDPVLIIPGLGGSHLYDDDKRIWPPSLTNVLSSKWIEELRIHYDHEKKGFGHPQLKGDSKDDLLFPYDTLIGHFENTVIGAYDFRRVGDMEYTERLYEKFQHKIETIYTRTNNTKCTLLSHSLGGLIVHDFLTDYCTPEWKSKYIRQSITLNTPYGGSIASVYALQHRQFGWPSKTNYIYVDFVKYISGVLWTLPNVFHMNNNHTISDILSSLEDSEELTLIYESHFSRRHYKIDSDSGVETHILYNIGIPTPSIVNNTKVLVDGDGTVDVDSLTLPIKWGRVNTKSFTGDHQSILKQTEVIEYIRQLVCNDSSLVRAHNKV